MSDIRRLARRVEGGELSAVARAISFVVDERPGSEELASELYRRSSSVHKVGLAGPPGSGKSTLTGRLISYWRGQGLKVGVLAVDPSSPVSGGAFLGDRLRIQDHAGDPCVYIRSLATRGRVGGLTPTIFGAIHVLEAAGFQKILVETVGVGQDEVEVAHAADTVLYVVTPGLGDEIQALKAGIMEIGDIFVVNKADLQGKDKAVADLRRALAIGAEASPAGGWAAPVLATSALTGEGIAALGEMIERHQDHLDSSGQRSRRLKDQLRAEVSLYLARRISRSVEKRLTERHLSALVERKTDPVTLGHELLDARGGA